MSASFTSSSIVASLALTLGVGLSACGDDKTTGGGDTFVDSGEVFNPDTSGVDTVVDTGTADTVPHDSGPNDVTSIHDTGSEDTATGDDTATTEDTTTAHDTVIIHDTTVHEDTGHEEVAAPECGNGVVEGSEACDGGAGCKRGETCADDCSACQAVAPACGDGTVNGDEQCDQSAAVNGCDHGQTCQGCTTCVGCQDGVKQAGEACDPTDLHDNPCGATDVCADDCSGCVGNTPPRCGDGKKNGSEACDASDIADTTCAAPKTCAADCSKCVDPAPICGDGHVNGTEECDATDPASTCDDGRRCGAPAGANACKCEAVPAACGDGTIGAGEVCDKDADCGAGQHCVSCLACEGASCGDGTVGAGETCDQSADDNGCGANGDGYSCDHCNVCYACGDGIVGDGTNPGPEACDMIAGLFGDASACGAGQICNSACQCQDQTLTVLDFNVFFTAQTFDFFPCTTNDDCVGVGDEVCGDDGFCANGDSDAAAITPFGLPVQFTAEIKGNPDDITDFNLIWINVDGEAAQLTDFVGESDLVLGDTIDDHGDGTFTWSFTVHFFSTDFDPIADYAGLVLYDANGDPSNVAYADDVDDEDYFGPLGVGEQCDSRTFYSECGSDVECVSDECVVGDDDVLVMTDYLAASDAAADTLTIIVDFTGTDVATFSPYALVLFGVDLDGDGQFDASADDAFGGFYTFDDQDGDGVPDLADLGDGAYEAQITFTGMSDQFAAIYPDGEATFADLLIVGTEIYDVSEKFYTQAAP